MVSCLGGMGYPLNMYYSLNQIVPFLAEIFSFRVLEMIPDIPSNRTFHCTRCLEHLISKGVLHFGVEKEISIVVY